ncbi:alpha-L-rhamnosidase [Lachnotalea glycerini]|uniref:alpha-L-rhamnosidase n=1 Tax=Lachnotalea glycerini TaxID=1763509 RepID=A0A318EQJ8_9FIRM|nr:alpha-L-rhamnosidase [Lachnotalea glycerini]PXV89450.1 alpha-L-rhamnosidase [Lachnotalea glycerini]
MKITKLRVNQIEKPIGFTMDTISFSWIIVDYQNAKKQKYAQIIVKKDNHIIFDSGKDENANSLDYQVQLMLEPRTRYSWEVAVTAENGESACQKSWFETGKLKEAWRAKWISPTFDKEIHPCFYKEITIDKKVKQARTYLTGLGLYELYLNGKKVGNEFLAPGYHSYDFHLQVHTYDITKYLIEGKNQIEVLLGAGWYKGRLGFDGGYTDVYGDSYYLIQELHIEYEDKTSLFVGTDTSWQCKPSAIMDSNIYDGELYDARLEAMFDYQEVVEREPIQCGPLTDRYSLPIIKKEKLKPLQLIKTKKGEQVLDFGQNITGWVEFNCNLSKDTIICLTASEIMQEGCFYNENYRTAKAKFTYISDGKKAHVRPHFTFFGFRYMKVECAEPIIKENFEAYHIRSDIDQIGKIETGHKKVNQLFSNALWSQKDNFLDVPTDCPQRDEKLGWTGDAQIFSDTACFNMYMPAFYRKYLWDMRAEQSILEGSVPNVVPRLKHDMISEHGSCPWADAGVIIPWNVYLHYGSKTLLLETYPGMKAWVDYQKKKEEALGGKHLVKDGFHFADWLALDNEKPGPFGATNALFIASAYYYHCSKIVGKAAKILGLEEDSIFYETLAEEIKKAIHETYFDKNGLCICKTQTASALVIEFGLMPEQEKKEGQKLKNLIFENKKHLNTGFVGTTVLCPALSKTGNHKLAVDLLLNEDYPGWLYAVNLGATTIWERWNSVMPDNSMNPEGMNSLNHYSYGSIESWMYRYICGFNPCEEEAGFRYALLAPHPDERLGFVKALFNTAMGTYISEWMYDKEGKVSYYFEVPFGAKAVIALKKGCYQCNQKRVEGYVFEVECGIYEIQEREGNYFSKCFYDDTLNT